MIHETLVLVILPPLVLFLILWICKYFNFTLIPPDLRPKPKKKKIQEMYKWNN